MRKIKEKWIELSLAAIFTILTGSVVMSFSSAIGELDKKADKTEVKQLLKQHEDIEDERFKTIDIKINHNAESLKQTKELFLYEVRELRKDLKLKEDKN